MTQQRNLFTFEVGRGGQNFLTLQDMRVIVAIPAVDIRSEIRLASQGNPLNSLMMNMIDVKGEMAGSCALMAAAKTDKAGLPTHSLEMLVNAYFLNE